MKKKIKYILLFILIAIGIGAFVISKHVLPYAIIQPPRISEHIFPSDLGLNSIDFKVSTKDSIELRGYWIKTDSIKPKSIIIFIHGIGGCKEHFLTLAKGMTKIGVESILIDSRAHGKSEGKFCTYGYKEKKDIFSVIDYIKKSNDSIPIGIWGNSMGGAIALQALEYDKRIKFGIVESTFTTLKEIVYDYQKSYTYGIGLKLICNMSLNEAGKLADFLPEDVSPISSVKNIEQPVIIAHGDNDENISFEYGERLYDNLKSTQKYFIPVKNGGHFNLAEKGGVEYIKIIQEFIIRNSI